MKIIIDASHGGRDPGATGNGSIEKDLALEVSLYQYERFKELGVEIEITRVEDRYIAPVDRADLVRRSGADYCISNHFNAGGGTGVETIHSIYNDGKLAHRIAFAIKDEGMPFRRVFCRSLDSDPKRDHYFMHRLTGRTTTIIVEYGFLDNIEDAERIRKDRIKYAEAVIRAVCSFLDIPYTKPKTEEEDPILEWAAAQGFDISQAKEKITYRDLWEIMWEMQREEVVEKNIRELEPMKHYKVALTDVIEVDPLNLGIAVEDRAANRYTEPNFVTGGYQMYQANGKCYPLSILVSEGKVIQNRQPHRVAAGTLIVYRDGRVDVKPVLDITKEKDVWFAVGGCSILPKIRMKEEGFKGPYADIGRATDRPVIGYNPEKNKVVIAVRPGSNIARGQQTLKNLGCTMGITLDAGGSTVLKVNNRFLKSTTRQLHSVVTFK